MHIVLLLATLASSDTLTGRVTDQSGQPVALATVEIAELSTRATTTADGAFQFSIPSGMYTLTVTRAGFAPASRTIAVRGTTTLDVRLAVSPFALEPVTVTATRQPIAPDLSPLPVASLTGASNTLELGGAARAEGARGSFGWRVAATGRYGSNLHTPAGELDNTGFGALNGEGSAGWRGAKGSLAVRVVHYGGEFKLLEANAPGEAGGPVRKLGDDRVVVNAHRPVGSWRLEAKGQFQRHRLTEVSDSATTESEAFNLLLQ